MSRENRVRSRKIKMLSAKGYRSVATDLAGRIVVEVHQEHFAEPELYRRVWGPDWPIVRSEPWHKNTPNDLQFEFRSREY